MLTWELITGKLALETNMVRAQSMVDNAPINTTMADRGWQRRRGFAELATRLNQIVTTVAVEGL